MAQDRCRSVVETILSPRTRKRLTVAGLLDRDPSIPIFIVRDGELRWADSTGNAWSSEPQAPDFKPLTSGRKESRWTFGTDRETCRVEEDDEDTDFVEPLMIMREESIYPDSSRWTQRLPSSRNPPSLRHKNRSRHSRASSSGWSELRQSMRTSARENVTIAKVHETSSAVAKKSAHAVERYLWILGGMGKREMTQWTHPIG